MITLIVMVAISGNMHRYLVIKSTVYFTYNFRFIPVAFVTMLIHQTVVPFIFYLVFKGFGSPLGFIDTLCGFSYSIISFIPAILFSSYPSGLLQWILLGLATFNSILFLSNNYNHLLVSINSPNNRYLIIGFVIIVQIALLLIIKIYFFTIIF